MGDITADKEFGKYFVFASPKFFVISENPRTSATRGSDFRGQKTFLIRGCYTQFPSCLDVAFAVISNKRSNVKIYDKTGLGFILKN